MLFFPSTGEDVELSRCMFVLLSSVQFEISMQFAITTSVFVFEVKYENKLNDVCILVVCLM